MQPKYRRLDDERTVELSGEKMVQRQNDLWRRRGLSGSRICWVERGRRRRSRDLRAVRCDKSEESKERGEFQGGVNKLNTKMFGKAIRVWQDISLRAPRRKLKGERENSIRRSTTSSKRVGHRQSGPTAAHRFSFLSALEFTRERSNCEVRNI